LVCEGSDEVLYRSPEQLDAGEAKDVSISLVLDPLLLGGLEGSCQIQAVYGNEVASTGSFTLSDTIDVNFELEREVAPGATVSVSGTAVKQNGQAVTGQATLSVEELGIVQEVEVSDGTFSASFDIPGDARGQNYNLEIRAVERQGDVVINSGSQSRLFSVSQIVSHLEIALHEVSVVPGNLLTYEVVLSDQAGEGIAAEVGVEVVDVGGDVVKTERVHTGESVELLVETTHLPGAWFLETTYEELSGSKSFTVEELAKVDVVLDENGTLVVTNMGNVPYLQPLTLSLSGIERQIDVGLGYGGVVQYALQAPDGSYDIRVISRDGSEELGNVALTGSAISVEELKRSFSGNLMMIFWLIVLLGLGVVAVFIYRKVRKKSFSGKTPADVKMKGKLGDSVAGEGEEDKSEFGDKQEVGVVVLNLRRYEELKRGKKGQQSVEQAVDEGVSRGGKLHGLGDERVLLFAPLFTHEEDNTLKAAKAAEAMEKVLNVHNATSKKDQVDFGIGVNTGDMIVERHEGKTRFTSVGTTMVDAKRLSKSAKKQVLLSQEAHGHTTGQVKVERAEHGWRLKGVPDRAGGNAHVRRAVRSHRAAHKTPRHKKKV
jgi:hypothetical protein